MKCARPTFCGLFLICFTIFYLCGLSVSDAQVPPHLKFILGLKSLPYNRSLDLSENKAINIGIIHDSNVTLSQDDVMLLKKATDKITQAKASYKFALHFINLGKDINFCLVLRDLNIGVVYLTPGLESRLDMISAHCQRYQLFSFAGNLEYCRKSICLAIVEKNHKPHLYLNLEASKAVGCNFKASFLRYTTIYRKVE